MKDAWDKFRRECQTALGHLVEGRSEPFKALWSRSGETVILGAFGGVAVGWEEVATRLDWASAGINATNRRVENLLTVIGADLACTVDLEHMDRTVNGRVVPRTLRCTQVYRLEDGKWKVIVRHADELATTDPDQG
jgi:ketosteroid isomerase-like protein